MNRREFLGSVAGLAIQTRIPRRIEIHSGASETFCQRLARQELLRGLHRLGIGLEGPPGGDSLSFSFRLEPGKFKVSEAYTISAQRGGVLISAGNEQSLLYAVFEFLERQGAFFGIDGESYPVEPVHGLMLPPAEQPWSSSPRFATRGLLPWPDFLNCITVYNEEDFRSYFDSMLRMRFNMFGMHVYTGANQWAESYLALEFAGVGHLAFLDTSATNRWGYLPQRTSRFTMGAADLYDDEVFGSDATRLVRDPWEAAERTQQLLKKAFAHASRLGIAVGIGFEPYQIPDEILRALPPEARKTLEPGRPGARFDIESVTARDLIEARLGQLLEAYPEVDYVWLWEDEQMNWDSRRRGEPLSVTPFVQAHDFLRRHAPQKKLVLSGWGGVARHFDSFHKRLPMDIVFTCLSDSLGWDPVNEVFSRLEGRERWPIPWLEDDPSMWLPQFRVHQFERDLNRASEFGCQGVLGIHWRHRIVDPTAGYLARAGWDHVPHPADYYQAYARTQAGADRAGRLATILLETDKDQKLLSTFSGEFKDGHAVTLEFSGDYSEGFTFWNDYEPKGVIVEAQKQIAAALRRLTDSAATPAEREKLEYLTKHIEFLVPYTEAWALAHRLQSVLHEAAKLKDAGKNEQARQKVRSEGVPLWLLLAPQVRRAMLLFQSVVSTRSDLGTLASMQNKFVRLALTRLRLSIKEYLGEIPSEMETLHSEVVRPDSNAPARLFVPTRPGIMTQDEKVRLYIVATGPGPVTLNVRIKGVQAWTRVPAKPVERRTFEATLGPFPPGPAIVEYAASAGKLSTPTYLVTLL